MSTTTSAAQASAATPATAALSAGGKRALLRQLSPVVTMTATYVVRKAMISAYEARTHEPAPVIYARNVSPIKKVIWTATVAAAVALIEIIVLEVIGGED